MSQWELVLVDNASSDRLEKIWDVSWHPNGRHVREDELGLTPARLRGISESKGGILIFVDDDNVLDTDYLEKAMEISTEWNRLGAWGGSIEPEYEVFPQDWALPYVSMLALRPVNRVIWSNDPTHLDAMPWGAGMCVRRPVALEYLRSVQVDPVRRALGRTGTMLGGGEDLDMVQTCPVLGLGFGLFPSLRILHLIPEGRLREEYLVRISEGSTSTLLILNAARGFGNPPPKRSLLKCVVDAVRLMRMERLERLMWRARQRAYRNAREVCLKHGLISK
jgi:glycosyltransferase involved in cell wall biosynthesis